MAETMLRYSDPVSRFRVSASTRGESGSLYEPSNDFGRGGERGRACKWRFNDRRAPWRVVFPRRSIDPWTPVITEVERFLLPLGEEEEEEVEGYRRR